MSAKILPFRSPIASPEGMSWTSSNHRIAVNVLVGPGQVTDADRHDLVDYLRALAETFEGEAGAALFGAGEGQAS